MPYCDLFLTEHSLRSLLNDRNLKLGDYFNCKVVSAPTDALAASKKLRHPISRNQKVKKGNPMRKLKCYDVHGTSVESVLEEFHERRAEFKIKNKDIVSVSTRTPGAPMKIASPSGSEDSTVAVTIFYWADED